MTRLLLDENCDPRLARALRDEGYDVRAILEEQPGASDEAVLTSALSDGRVLVSSDRDFSQLVFVDRRQTAGIVYLRVTSTELQIRRLRELLAGHASRLKSMFVVVEERRFRFRALPTYDTATKIDTPRGSA